MLHVTINRFTEAQFRSRYPALAAAEAVSTIHNTVDSAELGQGRRWATRRSMGIGDRDVLLVHPARNIGRKNIPVALEIAGELRRSGRKIHYWLTDPAGAVPPTPAGVTVHRGHTRRTADLYAAADLVVLPSRWEGWGLPVVEAAAARRPVVTFPYPVLHEIHHLGIRTVDHADVETMISLVSDPSCHHTLTSTNFRRAATLDIRRLSGLLDRALVRAACLMAAGGESSDLR